MRGKPQKILRHPNMTQRERVSPEIFHTTGEFFKDILPFEKPQLKAFGARSHRTTVPSPLQKMASLKNFLHDNTQTLILKYIESFKML